MTEEKTSPSKAPDIIQLERRGELFIMGTAVSGEEMKYMEISVPGDPERSLRRHLSLARMKRM